jgi:hypothetical protein
MLVVAVVLAKLVILMLNIMVATVDSMVNSAVVLLLAGLLVAERSFRLDQMQMLQDRVVVALAEQTSDQVHMDMNPVVQTVQPILVAVVVAHMTPTIVHQEQVEMVALVS